MLVLMRKPGQSLIIGGAVRITVVTVYPGRVRIVIEPMLPVAHTLPVRHTLRVDAPVPLSDDVTITLYSTSGRSASIGIDAPKAVSIDRAEIHYRKQLETPDAR